MQKPSRKIFNTWLLIHAVITLAAGVVLIVAPNAIPSAVGITLSPKGQLLAFFLSAAEIALAFLSFGARKIQDIQALSLIIWTFVIFHGATAVLELYDMILHGSSAVLWANVVVRIVAVVLFMRLKPKN